MKAISIGARWLAIAAATVPAMCQAPSGAEVYRRACATCHEQSNIDRIPQRAVIARMSPENVLAALTTGVMQAPAAGCEGYT
jgi:cytochrome c5